jgi:14-3-3 protein epsilon
MEKKIFMARVADQAERYEDMVAFLKEIMQESTDDLSVDVRNLLSVGFKNLIGS